MKMRIKNDKGLYEVEYNKLHNRDWLIEQYLKLRKTTTQIAQELGCVCSTVHVAIIRSGIPRRGRSEARIGIKFSQEHLRNIKKANQIKALRGSSHPNWQGGKTTLYDRRMAALKRSVEYKQWQKAVKVVRYCKICGSNENLEAHHILPKAKYPHFMFDITNGMCLCKDCHINLHLNVNGMNSGNPKNPEPIRVETRQVQRLLEEGTPSLITRSASHT
jgi:5-methylcytosine-specific restriction endonuclease McrA